MKKVILFIILPVVLFSCTSGNDEADVQEFYYEFIGFDHAAEFKELLRLVKNEYKFNDYLITNRDELIAFPRNEIISKDSLHKFHPVIHRIEPIEDIGELKSGDILMQIELLPDTGTALPSFAYKRFTLNAEKNLQLELDFGVHPLIGVRKNELLMRWSFIAEEYARASFK